MHFDFFSVFQERNEKTVRIYDVIDGVFYQNSNMAEILGGL